MNKSMPFIKLFEHLQIQLELIKSATNNFSDDHVIGRGGFGNVYKGELALPKGLTKVAIKRLNRAFGQGDPEFWKEVIMLSQYRHDNIVSLLGFCDDSGEKILVYEYAVKKSLDLYLHKDVLTWVRRLCICIGAAHGLAYLHDSVGTQQRVLHRDIKSSNILLDEDWNARISDLGLSKFGPANQRYTFLVSNTVGTPGYCDPLYAETGFLTKESDVYSFGVVLFEVFCGRLCFKDIIGNNKSVSFTQWVREAYEHNKIGDIVYSNIKNEINHNSLRAFTAIAYQCLNRDRERRPSMTQVVRLLESALHYQGMETHDQQKNNSLTYDRSMKFHFTRACRERFTLEELLGGDAEVLESGSLGTLYKVMPSGVLPDLLVRRFVPEIIEEGIEGFYTHMMLLGTLSHPNLLSYVAFQYDHHEKILVTDFAVNGSLASHLHDRPEYGGPGLDWPTRLKIIKGVAKGLDYLYQELPHKLPHGHLRSSSVLLHEDFNPLLADYALSPVITKKEAKEHLMAYKSLEFTQDKGMTRKTDVWCLGILILEILTGKLPVNYLEQGNHDYYYLGTWVNSVVKEEWTNKVFDKSMKWTKNNEIEMIDLMEIGLRCCEPHIGMRWDMKKAFEKIQGLKEMEDDEEYLSDHSTQGEDSDDDTQVVTLPLEAAKNATKQRAGSGNWHNWLRRKESH